MHEYEGILIYIRKGEVVKLKDGMLMTSALTGKQYLVKKAKYLGDGKWEILEKEEVKTTRKEVINDLEREKYTNQ